MKKIAEGKTKRKRRHCIIGNKSALVRGAGKGGVTPKEFKVTPLPLSPYHHPISQLICGQIFNDDVTIYSSRRLFSSW
jgi:hypothetical protein